MKLYAVTDTKMKTGLALRDGSAATAQSVGFRHVLVSYARDKDPGGIVNLSRVFDSVLLDCGAFSAFNSGVRIDLHAYIDFCKRYGGVVDTYAGLDVIGDEEATWRNQRAMEAAGLTPMPTFHFADSWNTLRGMVKEYDRIGLACMASLGMKERVEFLDGCWRIVQDSPRWPSIRVHGWAMTSAQVILRYPWYSVDSLTWAVGNIYGAMLVPSGVGWFKQVTRPRLPAHLVNASGAVKMRRSAQQLLRIEALHTELWARRGIVWEEDEGDE